MVCVAPPAKSQNPVPAEIVDEVARDFDLHIIDPLAQTPPQEPAPAVVPPGAARTNGVHGDNPPLIETLLQALNTLVDRMNQQAEATVDSDTERKR